MSFLECYAGELTQGADILDDRMDALRFPGLQFADLPGTSSGELADTVVRLEEHQQAWSSLTDQASRRLYARLLAFRALGAKHVTLPLDDQNYWDMHRTIAAISPPSPVDDGFGFKLGVYDLASFGFDFSLRCHALNVLDTFALRQYELDRAEAVVRARPGEVVIDGGAAWGDTALFFAERVGPTGRVIAVEFMPESMAILTENLERNAQLAQVVTVAEGALWRTSGDAISYRSAGPGTAIDGAGDQTTTTLTIDGLVDSLKLPRVDMIKLDVEGAELAALEGALHAIREWRPKLAISAYHRPEDLRVLPLWIRDLGLGYQLFLDHFTSHREETVLYATAAQ